MRRESAAAATVKPRTASPPGWPSPEGRLTASHQALGIRLAVELLSVGEDVVVEDRQRVVVGRQARVGDRRRSRSGVVAHRVGGVGAARRCPPARGPPRRSRRCLPRRPARSSPRRRGPRSPRCRPRAAPAAARAGSPRASASPRAPSCGRDAAVLVELHVDRRAVDGDHVVLAPIVVPDACGSRSRRPSSRGCRSACVNRP